MSTSGGRMDRMKAIKSLYTHLPTSCFGESLEMGVLRISEISTIISVGLIVKFIGLLISGYGGVATYLMGMLLMVVQLVCSLLLFIGVCQGNPVLMKPWFWFTVIVSVLALVLGSLAIIATPFLSGSASLNTDYAHLVILCAVLRYCVQAVYALMNEMSSTSADLPSSIHEASSTKDVREYDLSGNLES